jgi:tetratricopeptide (TPR) repeat protein
MEGKEPSYGYSVLSYLLSETLHRVVITTNFDNLVADALSIHSNRFPLVIGHDALAQYATVELRRPLIAKIHGALGFSPKSKPDDISQLPKGWCDALRRILDRYTPIVIGYEGNDGSLMGFLKELPADVPDRVFWCVYAPDARGVDFVQLVSQEVRDYVRSRRGRFVRIGGFDELMAKLFRKLGEKGSVPDLYENLKERARRREQSYDEQQRKLFEAAVPSRSDGKGEPESSTRGKVDRALSEAVSGIAESRKEKPWWVWVNEADAAPDVAAREDVYRRALEALPNDPDVLRNYAGFFERDSVDLDKAENCYQRSLAAAPNNPTTLAFYADFLNRLRKEPDKAEKYYQLALNSEPANPYAVREYASFLIKVRNCPDRAEDLYVRALEKRPADRRLLTSYEAFLRNTINDPAKADKIKNRLEGIN